MLLAKRSRGGSFLLWGACCAALLGAGCSQSTTPSFRLNVMEVEAKQLEPPAAQKVADALVAMFGTPDEPFVFPESGLDLRKLQFAAGPVSSDARGSSHGLYRQHCAHCHGITGDGLGPTAMFLNPYPRDYRTGEFKAKSTLLNARPTQADLDRLLKEGVPGTSMPSFVLLPQAEIDALVEYVKYLSMRGQVERRLILELGNEESLELNRELLIDTALADAAQAWADAEGAIIAPAAPPEVSLEESIALGRELFQGSTANCVKCHGTLALGDGQTDDFDNWSKTTKTFFQDVRKVKPEEIADLSLADFQDVGALPIRNIKPRNLRLGIFRFGRRPVDIYRRIHTGIAGTPMPGVGQSPENAAGLTPDQVWHLVNYVLRGLPYESLSEPPEQFIAAERSVY
ncbi:MAG: cytochrome c [Pirellulales bacterium]